MQAKSGFRERNKIGYRIAHWPIWIFVFFVLPGPWTFSLFEHGFSVQSVLWLMIVAAATGIAGLRGRLPGVEPKPYIVRFTEDRPNPLYRRVCYTAAWSEALAFTLINIAGLCEAAFMGRWQLRQFYAIAYFPIAGTIWVLGAVGQLPRVKLSTKGEGYERRYFYATVWAVCCAHPVLWALWKALPVGRLNDGIKLAVFAAILGFVILLAYDGRLPRTRPIVPGELAISD